MQPLSTLTTLGLGGIPRRLVEAHNDRTLIETVLDCDARGEPLYLLGGGSNTVASSAPLDLTVLHIATPSILWNGNVAVVAAGANWDAFVAASVARNLYGIESLSGIPGTVGATPIQNVGAYGQEVSETITAVRCLDRRSRKEVVLLGDECGFAYRDSRFKSDEPGRFVVLGVTFTLSDTPSREARVSSELRTPRALREEVLALRRSKAMVLNPDDPDTRSAGSFFTNPLVSAPTADAVEATGRARNAPTMPRFVQPDGRVKLAAGWLIENAGIARGFSLSPGARVSRRHALALTNQGGTSDDLLALARHVRGAVRAVYGVDLTPEPVFVGFGVADPTKP